jgi:acyl-CoA hydrolase
MADAGAMLSLLRGDSAGYLARWDGVDFKAVCNVGDYIEVRCELVETGNRSRRMRAEVVRLVRTSNQPGQTTKGEVLDPPELVAAGDYIGVAPRADFE